MSSDPILAAPISADDEALWLEIDETDPPTVVQTILHHVSSLRVSDLFLCAEEHYVSVSARHLGLWRRIGQLSVELGKRCLAHIKGQAGMDIAEKRRPLDGRWVHELDGETIDLRISTIPTLYGEDATLRLLERSSGLLELSHLGLLQRDLNRLLYLLSSPSGLILVTGPTGSGKTTTLYASLNHLNTGQRKINTIEDPIEYALVGVRQSQVNSHLGLGFPELLRGILRQAPDVVMVGEIRDVETAITAVRAASSGHLVLATLHASTAAAAVPAMLNLGVHPHHLASCLLGVVAQRLVRTLNPRTRKSYDFSLVENLFGEIRHLLEPGQECVLYGPDPEAARGELTYTGRVGVFEILTMTKAIRSLIVEQRTSQVIRQQAIAEGMIEMRLAALLSLARGKTSVEEVFRAIPGELLVEE